jgi:hypothetical protein
MNRVPLQPSILDVPTHAIFVAVLLLFNIAIKYTLWAQPPQTFTDSLSYLAPATSLLDGRGYGSQENGYRTPVYPLFLAAILAPFDHHELSECREPRVPACLGDIQYDPGPLANLRSIVLVQIILGALCIPLIYAFAWNVCHNHWVAALCALTYPLDLSTGYWEISLLSDALATFLLILSVSLTVIAAKSTQHRTLAHIALGVALAALALCQPIYLAYAIVPAAFLVIARIPESAASQSLGHFPHVKAKWNALLVLAIPVFLIILWSARTFYVDGFFTPSTLTGYNLTQMVGPFMEQAPEQYRDLAEIYVDTRAERIAAHGNHSGTIFLAYREMLDARKTTWAGLSRDLADLSLQLALKNPLGYLQVAGDSFDQFWKFGLGRQNPGLPASFDWVNWFFDSRVQQAAMILFLLSPVALLLAPHSEQGAIWVGFAIATVWFVAIVSSALNFGDNERYRTPVARLQYSSIILAAWFVVRRIHGRFPKARHSI